MPLIPLLTLYLTKFGSFGVLLILAKFIGRKQVAHLDFFNHITGIAIGSIAAKLAAEPKKLKAPNCHKDHSCSYRLTACDIM